MQADIRDFGAVADGNAINTQPIQAAIDAVAGAGGRVVVPVGTWVTGTVRLRSHVELHLERGAVLAGTGDPDHCPPDSPVAAGLVVSRRAFDRRLVYAAGVEDVAVTGPGCIDGRHGCRGRISGAAENQPNNLQFVACRRVRVTDLELRDAGSWMQQYLACEDVEIRGITVWNHGNRTNDGLDVDGCTDVRIVDCDIDSHDDALVFKSTGPAPCRDILVRGCRLRSNCHGIKFGTESVGGFEHVRISDCSVAPSREPAPMPGFPAGRPAITGCALECTDGGTMRGISIDGLLVDRAFVPFFVKLGSRHDRRIPGEDFAGNGTLEDVHIRDLRARLVGPIAASITGYPGQPVRGVVLDGITATCCGGVSADQMLEPVPENAAGYPEVNMFAKGDPAQVGRQLPAWALYLRHVEGVSLRDLRFALDAPDARRPVVVDDVTDLTLAGLRCGDLRGEDCLERFEREAPRP